MCGLRRGGRAPACTDQNQTGRSTRADVHHLRMPLACIGFRTVGLMLHLSDNLCVCVTMQVFFEQATQPQRWSCAKPVETATVTAAHGGWTSATHLSRWGRGAQTAHCSARSKWIGKNRTRCIKELSLLNRLLKCLQIPPSRMLATIISTRASPVEGRSCQAARIYRVFVLGHIPYPPLPTTALASA